eukprot:5901890-Prymnesium_polylepis.1
MRQAVLNPVRNTCFVTGFVHSLMFAFGPIAIRGPLGRGRGAVALCTLRMCSILFALAASTTLVYCTIFRKFPRSGHPHVYRTVQHARTAVDTEVRSVELLGASDQAARCCHKEGLKPNQGRRALLEPAALPSPSSQAAVGGRFATGSGCGQSRAASAPPCKPLRHPPADPLTCVAAAAGNGLPCNTPHRWRPPPHRAPAGS